MEESKDLAREIHILSNRKALTVYENKWKLMWYNFLTGIAGGFGAVIGATILIALLIFVLGKFEWVPIVGDFIAQVIVYLEAAYTQ